MIAMPEEPEQKPLGLKRPVRGIVAEQIKQIEPDDVAALKARLAELEAMHTPLASSYPPSGNAQQSNAQQSNVLKYWTYQTFSASSTKAPYDYPHTYLTASSEFPSRKKDAFNLWGDVLIKRRKGDSFSRWMHVLRENGLPVLTRYPRMGIVKPVPDLHYIFQMVRMNQPVSIENVRLAFEEACDMVGGIDYRKVTGMAGNYHFIWKPRESFQIPAADYVRPPSYS